jgi:hypothetical protein
VALVTERVLTIRTDWLTVDIEYDDVSLRLETVTVTPTVPAGHFLTVGLNRGGNPSPWREATFDVDSSVWVESRPFGGGFRTLDQIDGHNVTAGVV